MTEDLLIEHAGNVESLTRWVDTAPPKRPAPDHVRALLSRLRAERDPRGDAAWFAIPDERRAQLLALLTERDTERAHMVRWSELTDDEKAVIGTEARGLVRDLGRIAGALR